MKFFRYLTALAVTALALGSCEQDPADLYSADPVAPVMDSHVDILMTEATIDEDVTFSWKAARNVAGDVSYTLYASYGEARAEIARTDGLYCTIGKAAFRTRLLEAFELPVNDNFAIALHVEASNGADTYASEAVSVNIFAYGDYVPAVVSVIEEAAGGVVLTVDDAAESLAVVTWEPARLGYAEAVTYSVLAQYASEEPVELAKDLKTTSFAMTVDEWNEALAMAGAPEAETSDIALFVKAFSDTCTNGLESQSVTVKFTTYVSTYPDFMYTAGSHQGWNPATAFGIPQSTTQKGLYEAFADLRTADGSDVEFKFCVVRDWGGDFGATDVVIEDKSNTKVVTASTTTGDNIKVPSGIYRVVLNKKMNTLLMVRIESVGIIGPAVDTNTATQWNEAHAIPMEYDAASNTYTVTTDFVAGEYKILMNNNWDYSIGEGGNFGGGDNYKFSKPDGEYKVTLNVNKAPYEVNVASTSVPGTYYVVGVFNGWNEKTAPAIWETAIGSNVYEGIYDMTEDKQYNPGLSPFQILPALGTWEGQKGYSAFSALGENLSDSSGNIGVEAGICKLTMDLSSNSLTATEVSMILRGGWDTNWNEFIYLKYDPAANVWTSERPIAAGTEFKLCLDETWTLSYAGGTELAENMPEGETSAYELSSTASGNLVVPGTSGSYYVRIYADRTPMLVAYRAE